MTHEEWLRKQRGESEVMTLSQAIRKDLNAMDKSLDDREWRAYGRLWVAAWRADREFEIHQAIDQGVKIKLNDDLEPFTRAEVEQSFRYRQRKT